MDGKRSASDVPDLEEPAAKRLKVDDATKQQLTPEEIEILRRKAEGLDEVAADDDSGDEKPAAGGNRRNEPREAEEPEERTDGKPGAGGPKHNYVILFGYLGEAYQGLQRNPDAITIEPILEEALYQIGCISDSNRGSYSKISWSRSARTDKGVSAIGCIISMKLIDKPNMVEELNKRLPHDIRVFGACRVTKNFRAKNRADARHYEYIVPTSCFAPSRHVASEEERAKFVFDASVKKRVEEAQAVFLGTHNFFNFTSEIKGDDMRANRFIRKFWCSEPYMVEDVEFVTLSVIGQSFVLNQIRKMVAAVVAVVRDNQHPDVINGLFIPVRERNIHMAPGEGLMLREVLFDSYNKKNASGSIDWSPCIANLEEFKKSMIVPHLVKSVKRGLFSGWLNFWDEFPMEYEVLKQRYYSSPQYEKDQRKMKWKQQDAAIAAEKAAAQAAAASEPKVE